MELEVQASHVKTMGKIHAGHPLPPGGHDPVNDDILATI